MKLQVDVSSKYKSPFTPHSPVDDFSPPPPPPPPPSPPLLPDPVDNKTNNNGGVNNKQKQKQKQKQESIMSYPVGDAGGDDLVCAALKDETPSRGSLSTKNRRSSKLHGRGSNASMSSMPVDPTYQVTRNFASGGGRKGSLGGKDDHHVSHSHAKTLNFSKPVLERRRSATDRVEENLGKMKGFVSDMFGSHINKHEYNDTVTRVFPFGRPSLFNKVADLVMIFRCFYICIFLLLAARMAVDEWGWVIGICYWVASLLPHILIVIFVAPIITREFILIHCVGFCESDIVSAVAEWMLNVISVKHMIARSLLTIAENLSRQNGDTVIQNLESIFTTIDDDGDGNISISEFENVLETLKIKVSGSNIRPLFRGLDRDRSGCIDYSEFISIILTNYESYRRHTVCMEEPVMSPGSLRRKTDKLKLNQTMGSEGQGGEGKQSTSASPLGRGRTHLKNDHSNNPSRHTFVQDEASSTGTRSELRHRYSHSQSATSDGAKRARRSAKPSPVPPTRTLGWSRENNRPSVSSSSAIPKFTGRHTLLSGAASPASNHEPVLEIQRIDHGDLL